MQGDAYPANLLVVGLDTDRRMRFEYRLLEAGFALRSVAFAETLAEARSALHRVSPECILVDLGLPEPSGVHAVSVLAAAAPEVPIVVTSSSDCDPDLIYEALSAGAVDHIVDEGWHPIALREVVTRAYRRHEEMRVSNEHRHVLESILATIDDAACVLDPSGRVLAVNAQWTSVGESHEGEWWRCGLAADFVSVCERAGANGVEGAKEMVDGIRALRAGTVARFVHEYRSDAGGEERWFELRAVLMSGRQSGAVIVHRDVTALKHAQPGARPDPEWAQRILGEEHPIFAMVGADGTITHVSDSTLRLLGGVGSSGLPSFFSIELHDREVAEEAFGKVLGAPGAREHLLVHVVDGTGQVRSLDLEICNRVDDPVIGAVTVAGRDVTGEAAEHVGSGLLEALPAAVVACGTDGAVVSWNAGATELFGYDAREVVGHPALGVAIWPDELVDDEAGMVSVPESRWEGAYEARRSDGVARRVRAVLARVDGEVGFRGVVGAWVGADEPGALDPEAALRALHDPATGLVAGRLFADHLALQLAQDEHASRLTAVLAVGVDAPGPPVDGTVGGPADEMLRLAAERLVASVRPGDLVARHEAGDLVVCCAGLSGDAEALAVAERVRQALGKPPATGPELRAPDLGQHPDLDQRPGLLEPPTTLEIVDGAPQLPVSVGVAISEPDTTADELLANAGFALRLAREGGHGRLELFDGERHRQAREQVEMGVDLGDAVEGGDIEVAYQPLYELASGEICGFEALARWTHPDWGPVEPQDFIRAAELSGSIVQLGERVLATACRMLAKMKREVPDRELTMTVNVSAIQLADPGFPQTVSRIVERAGVPSASVCLEITGAALANADAATETLSTLRALGVQVSIDDFGTEYSSLARLQQFPIDYLKIDRSFVAGLVDRPVDAAIVHALLGLASSLDVRSVAEGVEDERQLELLATAGCELGQGFYWSKPLPPGEALDLLHAP